VKDFQVAIEGPPSGWIRACKGARFTVLARRQAGIPARLAVAFVSPGEEGVSLAGNTGEGVTVPAGFEADLGPDGRVGRPAPRPPVLQCVLSVAGQGFPSRVSLCLRNAGPEDLGVAGYHPLGAHYQLELLRPGAKTPEFVKLDPFALRKKTPLGDEALAASKGEVVLKPGEGYALEIELKGLFRGAGLHFLTGHYAGFCREALATHEVILQSDRLAIESKNR
jgi:hypothetical protein